MADTITGGAGNDIIDGRGGPDLLNGGAGNDIITGFVAEDTVDGGAGEMDTIQLYQDLNSATDAQITNVEHVAVGGGAPGITINLSNQSERFRITGGFGDDRILSGSEDDEIDMNTVDPVNGYDWISCGAGDDSIRMVSGILLMEDQGRLNPLVAGYDSAADAQITNVEKVFGRHAGGITINLGNEVRVSSSPAQTAWTRWPIRLPVERGPILSMLDRVQHDHWICRIRYGEWRWAGT